MFRQSGANVTRKMTAPSSSPTFNSIALPKVAAYHNESSIENIEGTKNGVGGGPCLGRAPGYHNLGSSLRRRQQEKVSSCGPYQGNRQRGEKTKPGCCYSRLRR